MNNFSKIALITCLTAISACSGMRPDNLGVSNNALLDCPSSPNCVNSQATEEPHSIAPLKLKQPLPTAQVIEHIKAAISKMPSMKVIEETDIYLYAEATTQIMRFVDDVEFLVSAEESVIHIRSASRLGYKDFDANRNRIEEIRNILIEEGIITQIQNSN